VDNMGGHENSTSSIEQGCNILVTLRVLLAKPFEICLGRGESKKKTKIRYAGGGTGNPRGAKAISRRAQRIAVIRNTVMTKHRDLPKFS